MKTMFNIGISALFLSAAFFVSDPALGQTYPVKSIRVVVAFAPGGPTDVLGRLVAQKISANIGQTMVVDNRPGANGIIGTELVAKSAPDGYTLILASIGHTVNPSLYEKVPYDPIKDFAPITLLAKLPQVVVTHPTLPVNSMRDLVALAKARPGELSFGSGGTGSSQHLAGEMLKLIAKIDMVHVPYKGAGPALVDVMAGQISFMFYPLTGIAQSVKTGKIKALAVGAKERLEELPGVPTTAESGYPGFEESASWIGYLAPAGTPTEIINKLYAEVTRTLVDPEVKQKIKTLGAVVVANSPGEYGAFLRADVEKWAQVIKATGAKAN